jgi:hypothetical protein
MKKAAEIMAERLKKQDEAAKAAGETLIKRAGKLGRKAAPLPIGVVITIILFPKNAQAKGPGWALLEGVADDFPVVEWGKGITEFATGKDWIPAYGEQGIIDWYLETARAYRAGDVGKRFTYSTLYPDPVQ